MDTIMLHDLSNQELRRIFNSEKADARILRLMEEEDLSWSTLCEHAMTELYRRRFEQNETLNEIEFDELRSYLASNPLGGVVPGIVGEAAKKNMLSEVQCIALLPEILGGEWASKQIRARLLLFQRIANRSLVDAFVELKTPWAILELLEELSSDDLEAVRLQMRERNVLDKSHRHRIRERIKTLLSSRKSSGKA